jgi:thioredoxin-like negative regulator of GroEL
MYAPGMGLMDLFRGRPKVLPREVRTLDAFRREVLESKLPVIVDVWSPSCGPCKKLVPVLINVATRHDGRVVVAEISTDAEPALLARLGVRATPTILVFDRGTELGRMTGFRPESWFDDMISTEFGSSV